MKKRLKYIYGPVSSWRLGSSLGIDPVSGKVKICTFDCIYCQLGKTKIFSDRRRIFVPTQRLLREIKMLPALEADYITFSGTAEPTLAKNLGQMIKVIRGKRRERIAVLTNASLIYRQDVQRDLLLADFVAVKIDANSQDLFLRVNKPMKKIKFPTIIKAIGDFRDKFKGELGLQIMFVKENKRYAKEIAQIAAQIRPDEIQINTPLRPSQAAALSKKELKTIEDTFLKTCAKNTRIVSVYKAKNKKVIPINKCDTLRRRPKLH
ncbi:MAG: radical SAM protein [Candidatus Omnitrophica bacterium]|nr:radical SAM protein [Candidatus Omnitrophota bacterium]